MKNWDNRATEIAYLLNPAFCGRIIYHAIKTYQQESKRPMPFPLVYLILPMVLHRKTRERIKSITQMQIWIQRNPEMLIGFADRAQSMVPITNEAVEFLMQSGIVTLTNNAELELAQLFKALSTTKYTNDEIKECISKSSSVAKWFAKAGTVETIYVSWGVRP
nr:three component ABC system middle component [Sedimentibacter sp.]